MGVGSVDGTAEAPKIEQQEEVQVKEQVQAEEQQQVERQMPEGKGEKVNEEA
jgi:hypothetical protein